MKNTFKKYPQVAVAILCNLLAIILIVLNHNGVNFPAYIAFGELRLNFYGIFIITAVFTVTYFADKHLQSILPNHGLQIWEQLPWIIFFGVVGARLFHVISDWQLYQDNFMQAFYLWDGGLSLFGAILFGGIYLYWYVQSKKLPVLEIMAIVVLFLPLGQIIGRFGNFFNQELFGPATNLPWGIHVAREAENFVHPVFWYEQVLNTTLLILLVYFYNRSHKDNYTSRKFHALITISIYCVGYGLIRLFTEQLRMEAVWLVGLSFGEVMAIILLLLGCVVLFRALKTR